MLTPDFFQRKFPPGTAGYRTMPWYPLSGDARWKTVLLRLAGMYTAYAVARYLLVPEAAGMGNWQWTALLFFHGGYALTIFILGFGVAFALMILFWLKYRTQFPGVNHAVNIAIPPMAVLCLLMVWAEMTSPRAFGTNGTPPPAVQPHG